MRLKPSFQKDKVIEHNNPQILICLSYTHLKLIFKKCQSDLRKYQVQHPPFEAGFNTTVIWRAGSPIGSGTSP
jgi:hypothetical protein